MSLRLSPNLQGDDLCDAKSADPGPMSLLGVWPGFALIAQYAPTAYRKLLVYKWR